MKPSEVDQPYIIAEIGPNWCISADRLVNEERLTRLIDLATVAGANAIKLQLKSLGPGGYYTEVDLQRPAPLGSPFKTRREYAVAREPDRFLLEGVASYCSSRGLDWSASPWDLPSVALLAQFNVPWVKIASASITDLPLLRAIRGMDRHVILSTGMSTQDEVDKAVEVFGAQELTLLHCVSTYPCKVSEIDLMVMETLRNRYGCDVGWSGHERGIDACVAAAALGASVIERHITLDRDEWGPDHAASLDPPEFFRLVKGVRSARHVALAGTGIKTFTESEAPARERLRR